MRVGGRAEVARAAPPRKHAEAPDAGFLGSLAAVLAERAPKTERATPRPTGGAHGAAFDGHGAAGLDTRGDRRGPIATLVRDAGQVSRDASARGPVAGPSRDETGTAEVASADGKQEPAKPAADATMREAKPGDARGVADAKPVADGDAAEPVPGNEVAAAAFEGAIEEALDAEPADGVDLDVAAEAATASADEAALEDAETEAQSGADEGGDDPAEGSADEGAEVRRFEPTEGTATADAEVLPTGAVAVEPPSAVTRSSADTPLAPPAPLPDPRALADEADPTVATRWTLLKNASGNQVARVSLDHPSLGPLSLDIAVEQGEVDLRVLAPTLLSALRLQRDEASMRRMLKEHGARLGALRVDVPESARRREPAPKNNPSRRALPGRVSTEA